MAISISPAHEDDLFSLAAINYAAHAEELPMRFAHKNWRDPDSMLDFFAGRLGIRLRNADTQVFKAVVSDSGSNSGSGRIVGFVCWTYEKAGGEEKSTPTREIMAKMPDTLNKEFVMAADKIMGGLTKHMRGEDHYYVSSFAVAPEYQGKGIGSQLLVHCLGIADEKGVPTWLMAFPGSHDLFGRFGFEDVDYRDIDLNAWDGNRCRGYGIYRNYAMRRGYPAS